VMSSPQALLRPYRAPDCTPAVLRGDRRRIGLG
jgi:hypothetical protein